MDFVQCTVRGGHNLARAQGLARPHTYRKVFGKVSKHLGEGVRENPAQINGLRFRGSLYIIEIISNSSIY